MMQIIQQTHDETVAMYMKGCTKKQLAEMLASCNEALDTMPPKIVYTDVGYISPTLTAQSIPDRYIESILPERFY